MSNRLQLLFVDDEPLVLEGLRRQFRPLREQWELSTALGGEEALRQIAAKEFDVVVSDMRMPGLDGAGLLAEVAQQQPRALRIILSGFSERENTLRSLGPAHRWLSKPCEAGLLRQAVERSLRLRAEMAQPAVAAVLAAVDDLLLLPPVLRELLNELASAEPSSQRAAGILARDPQLSLATALLAEAIGLKSQALTQSETALLATIPPGILRGLALAAHLQTCCGSDQDGVWEHGLNVSHIARHVTVGLPLSVQEMATTAGLLHDGGRLILASLGMLQRESLAASCRRGLALTEAEKEVYGCDHALLGAALLSRWHLPDPLVEAVAWHHRPTLGGLDGALAVHLADALSGARESARLDDVRVAEAGLTGRLAEWQAWTAANQKIPGNNFREKLPCVG